MTRLRLPSLRSRLSRLSRLSGLSVAPEHDSELGLLMPVLAFVLLCFAFVGALTRHVGMEPPSALVAVGALATPLALALGGCAVGLRRGAGMRRRPAPGHDDTYSPVDLVLEHRVERMVKAARAFEVVYQPIVDLGSGTRVGNEALARFPDGRAPDVWFEEARHLGLGLALEMAAIWRAAREYAGGGELSLNLSASTVMSREFLDFLNRCPAGFSLVIELTEHVSVDDYEALRQALEPIRRRGVRVAVDDTGSGVASMHHVLAIAPDIIKLDCSLVASIDRDDGRRAFAASLGQFAGEMGAVIVAEGIEREEEFAVCHDLGIAFGQGYFLGRPARQDA